MSRNTIVILALVFSVAVAALPRVLPPLAGIWAALKYAYKSYPSEHRWIVIRRILRQLVKRHKRIPPPRTEEEAWFRLPDDPARTVPFDQWKRVDSLVTLAVCLTTPEMRMHASSLDVDGSVTLVRRRDDVTSDITVLAPDGTSRPITGPHGVVSASTPFPSIDRGTVAWWQVALDGKSALLWIAEKGVPPRVLHTEFTPDGLPIPLPPGGWVRVAGDQVVWTMLSGELGWVGVTSLNGTTRRIGRTRYPTVHRDRSAEHEGRRVFAVNLAESDFISEGQVVQLDLDGAVPELRRMRAGAFPGASVCRGAVVGFWRSRQILQLPGALWVQMPLGAVVADIISDGEWAAGRVLRSTDGPRKAGWVHELFHLPTGAIQQLCQEPHGIVDIRAGRILWASKPKGSPDGGQISWVGQLRAPTPTVESMPTQAAPGS